MTEAEWLTCHDPQQMLEFLRGKVSDRKLRLFAVACCRRVWKYLWDQRSKTSLEKLESFLEKGILQHEIQTAYAAARETLAAIRADPSEQQWYYVQEYAAEAVMSACCDEVPQTLRSVVEATVLASDDQESRVRQMEKTALAFCLREIVNHFTKITLNPTSLTATVTSLAESIYASRDFEQLPILADALEEAGCSSVELLGYMSIVNLARLLCAEEPRPTRPCVPSRSLSRLAAGIVPPPHLRSMTYLLLSPAPPE